MIRSEAFDGSWATSTSSPAIIASAARFESRDFSYEIQRALSSLRTLT